MRQYGFSDLGSTHCAPAPGRDADNSRHQDSKVPSQAIAIVDRVVWIHVLVHLDWCDHRVGIGGWRHWKDKAPWPGRPSKRKPRVDEADKSREDQIAERRMYRTLHGDPTSMERVKRPSGKEQDEKDFPNLPCADQIPKTKKV